MNSRSAVWSFFDALQLNFDCEYLQCNNMCLSFVFQLYSNNTRHFFLQFESFSQVQILSSIYRYIHVCVFLLINNVLSLVTMIYRQELDSKYKHPQVRMNSFCYVVLLKSTKLSSSQILNIYISQKSANFCFRADHTC